MKKETAKDTENLLLHIMQKRKWVSITELMKLSYLIDYTLSTKNLSPITGFSYIRYFYGPFDRDIYRIIEDLIRRKEVVEDTEFSDTGREYIVYGLANKAQDMYDYLSDIDAKRSHLVQQILEKLSTCNSKLLTQIAYNTKPIEKIGARIGNEKGIGENLTF